MTDEATFLKAICDSPNDIAPRLIYCDWLEEEYERRGPTPLGEICPRQRASNIRQQIESGSVIFNPLANQLPLRYYRNGFIELICILPTDWAREADLITSRHPINQVVFSEMPMAGVRPGSVLATPGLINGNRGRIPGVVLEAKVVVGDKSFNYQDAEPTPDGRIESNHVATDTLRSRLNEYLHSIKPYREIWPQISFHTIKTGRSIQIDRAGRPSGSLWPVCSLDPPDNRPIGDMLERHLAAMESRSGRLLGIAREDITAGSYGRVIPVRLGGNT